MNILFALLAVLCAAPSSGVAGADDIVWITLRERAEVVGLRVRLGDLAEVKSLDPALARRLERLEVGRFGGGATRFVLEAETLERMLEERGHGGEGLVLGGASRVVALPKTVTLEASRLDALCRAHVEEALNGRSGVGEIRVASPLTAVAVPASRWRMDLRVRPDRANPHYAGRVELAVEVLVDGEIAREIPVAMQVEREVEIVVAKRRIARGQVVSWDDVELLQRPLGRGVRVFRTVQDALGRVAQATIARGQPLDESLVKSPPVIRRGDVVSLRVRVGRLEARALCRARDEGAPGDRIALENLESRKIVYGVVVDSRTAEAVLGP